MIRCMRPLLSSHLLPHTVDPDTLAGSIAVMIDVLRASTTITHALAAGCNAIHPCRDVETARTLAQGDSGPDPPHLLAGERGGIRIDGFDLDNSPASFTPSHVGGRTIVFTTTNGTAALDTCRGADHIIVASFSNLGTVCHFLAQHALPVHLVCAGTNGHVTAEDCLCAGAIGLTLQKHGNHDTDSHDATRMVTDLFAPMSDAPDALLHALRGSHGGRNLSQLGFDTDIVLASRQDTLDLIPCYDSQNQTITMLA